MNWFKKLFGGKDEFSPSDDFQEATKNVIKSYALIMKIINSSLVPLGKITEYMIKNPKKKPDELVSREIRGAMIEGRKIFLEAALLGILSKKICEKINTQKNYDLYEQLSKIVGADSDKMSFLEEEIEKIMKGNFNPDED